MSFTAAEREAVTAGRIDYFKTDGVTPLLDYSIATQYQKTNQGESWTDWVENLVDTGQLQIRIWDADRY